MTHRDGGGSSWNRQPRPKKQVEERKCRLRIASKNYMRSRLLTNSNLIAPKNYESVGFVLYDRKENSGETAFAGDYLYYRIQL